MPIVVNLDVMLARRKMKLGDLSAAVDISLANLSILKSGRARAVQFSTLEALCRVARLSAGGSSGVQARERIPAGKSRDAEKRAVTCQDFDAPNSPTDVSATRTDERFPE